MGRVGRFVCVSVPFILTIGSLICILIVCLAGVTNKSLYLLKVNTEDFSISSSELESLAKRDINLNVRSLSGLIEDALTTTTSDAVTSSSSNITAADLSLADSYEVALWTYCTTSGSDTTCTSPAFNYASNATNTTKYVELAESVAGVTVTIPSSVTSALKTFSTISYITQIIYTVAFALTILELVLGIFALCSRIGSCCTFIISGLQTVALIAASVLATVLASVATGAIEGLAKGYGVTANINTSFLVATWFGVALSLGSSLFWMFSICCCKGDRNKSGKGETRFRDSHQTPLVPAAVPFSGNGYQRVQDPYAAQVPAQNAGGNGYQRVQDPYAPQTQTAYGGYQVPMTQVRNSRQQTGAYEPYSHDA